MKGEPFRNSQPTVFSCGQVHLDNEPVGAKLLRLAGVPC